MTRVKGAANVFESESVGAVEVFFLDENFHIVVATFDVDVIVGNLTCFAVDSVEDHSVGTGAEIVFARVRAPEYKTWVDVLTGKAAFGVDAVLFGGAAVGLSGAFVDVLTTEMTKFNDVFVTSGASTSVTTCE